jgi:adenine-specific DNA-methyltransferase
VYKRQALQRWGANYWEDFFRPKIIYPNMTKYLPFVFDESGYLTNQKCFIVTGEKIEFLTAFLNSSVFKYCFRDNFPELLGGTRELSKIFFDQIPVIEVTDSVNNQFRILVKKVQELKMNNQETKKIETEIENLIFDLYGLSKQEILEISSKVTE